MTGIDLAALGRALQLQLDADQPPVFTGEQTARPQRRQRPTPTIDMAALGSAINSQLGLLDRYGSEPAVGWVPLTDVAWGTYGCVTGVSADHTKLALTGYIMFDHTLTGGLGGRGGDVTAVYVAREPGQDFLTADVVYADPACVVTVLTPPAGMPTLEHAPFSRMPIEEQVIAAGALAGLPVTVHPGPPNPLYQVGEDEPTALSRAADYLLAHGFARSLGLSRPVPHPNRIRRPS